MHDEFARIEWLKNRFALRDDAEGVAVGIGDDAAVLDFGKQLTIATIDTQVENVHFRQDLIAPRELGYRAMVAAVSDVWAMGGRATAALVALTLPAGVQEEAFRELIDGLADAAQATGARVVGGNLSGADLLTVTTSVFGAPVREPIARSGAKPGESVYVTGTLGAAALGLHILEAGALGIPDGDRFAERWKRPPINDRLAAGIAQIATAAVDVSDGCVQDLQHLCSASGVGATLRAGRAPTARGHDAACKALGLDPILTMLTGGEDYELIFTAPPSERAAALGTPIGEITEGSEVRVVGEDGAAIDVAQAGFRHFS